MYLPREGREKNWGGKDDKPLTFPISWISRHEHLGENAWVPHVNTLSSCFTSTYTGGREGHAHRKYLITNWHVLLYSWLGKYPAPNKVELKEHYHEIEEGIGGAKWIPDYRYI